MRRAASLINIQMVDYPPIRQLVVVPRQKDDTSRFCLMMEMSKLSSTSSSSNVLDNGG